MLRQQISIGKLALLGMNKMDIVFETALALIGAGILGSIATSLINKGKQQKTIEQNTKEIACLRGKQDSIESKVQIVEQGTDVRLTKIETQVTAIQTQVIDIAKDVKQILKQGKYIGD